MEKNRKIGNRGKIAVAISAVSVCLIAVIVGCIVASCVLSAKSPVIMEYGDVKMRASFYEFMLSRMRGDLYRKQYDVESGDFWNGIMSGSDKTYEEYYNDSILESCKVYLVSLALYDELVKSGELSELPQSYYDEIDEDIELYISLGYVGDGSKEKFNSILSDYGVDADILREIYVCEAKAEYLRSYLYGGDSATKIGDAVKEEYYNENYFRFKQIFVGNFYYKYITDKFGNVIYFDGDDGDALYDEKNGIFEYDEDGNHVKDDDGVDVRIDKDTGEYVYDKENGTPRYIADSDGTYKKFYYSESEMAERRKLAQNISQIQKGDFETFEEKGKDKDINTDYSESFSNSGIYMSDIESGLYSGYMSDILTAVKNMEVGEISVVEADDGYHVIMRYELDEGAYAEDDNAEWFKYFNTSLITKMYLEKCRGLFDKIEIDTDVLSRAKSIKEIGTNTDY